MAEAVNALFAVLNAALSLVHGTMTLPPLNG
jgi:hypothetical protein